MTARLLTLNEPLQVTSRNIGSELLRLQHGILSQDANVETFEPGKTYTWQIEGSSINYTLILEPNGQGMLQRTIPEKGSKHATGIRGEKVRSFRVHEDVPLSEIFSLTDAPMVMPILVGEKTGMYLRAVFFYNPQ